MQTMKRISASLGTPSRLALAASLILIPLAMGVSAHAQTSEQTPEQGTTAAVPVIPQQVRYAGKLVTRSGDTVEAVFSIYAAPEGGEPLWTETQQVTVDADGAYTVLLGSASPSGLPQTLFAGGAARWLGVSVERAPELQRALLSSVPYAMKSADAQALAGHPAGDFVTQGQLSEQFSQFAQTEHTQTPELNPLTSGAITGSGTTGAIAEFTGTNTIGNSVLTQSGTSIGVNEATPVATLDVNGAGQFRGALTLPATNTATTSTGYNSQLFQWSASAWSTTAAAVVSPTFRVFAVPVNNNTATPSANLEFTYKYGTSQFPVFSISSAGLFTSYDGFDLLAAGVASPSGSYSSPNLEFGASSYSSTLSAPVAQNFAWYVHPTGNNTASPSGNLTLLYGAGTSPLAATGFSISPTGTINWAPGQTFPGTGAGTITGITTTSPLTGSGTSGSVALGLNTTALETTFNSVYPQLGTSNTFNGEVNNFNEVQAGQGKGTGYSAIVGYGLNGSYGVSGSSDTGFGVIGTSTSGTGVYGTSTGTGYGGYFINNTTVSPAIWAENDATGNPGLGVGVKAYVPNGYSIGVLGKAEGNNSYGVFGENVGGTDSYGVYASTTGTGGNAVYGKSTGGADANGALGSGVVGISAVGNGVYGNSEGASTIGTDTGPFGSYGVWGDAGNSGPSAFGGGILGTADERYAGVFENNGTNETVQADNSGAGPAATFTGNSTYQGLATVVVQNQSTGEAGEMINDSNNAVTLYLSNNGTGGITDSAEKPGTLNGPLFKTLMASTPTGTCGIGGNGDLSCTGQVKSIVSAGGGSRKVETYAMQSPENWMEDFGSGKLQKGVAVISIDPTFAETVTADDSYHVFITPNGDSEALYVINKTATSFEVRESKGGTSSLTFDYRIVAKRRGYEGQRHVDVTESYNAEMKTAKLAMGSGVVHRPAAMAKSPLQAALNSHPRQLVPARSPVPHQPMSQPANTSTKR